MTDDDPIAIAHDRACSELEDAAHYHLGEAIKAATDRWDRDYAFLYLIGVLHQTRRAELGPSPAPKKGKIPHGLRWAVFERDDFRCQHCGTRTSLRADHKIPESAGGSLCMDNLQTLCHSCNSKKGAKQA